MRAQGETLWLELHGEDDIQAHELGSAPWKAGQRAGLITIRARNAADGLVDEVDVDARRGFDVALVNIGAAASLCLLTHDYYERDNPLSMLPNAVLNETPLSDRVHLLDQVDFAFEAVPDSVQGNGWTEERIELGFCRRPRRGNVRSGKGP